MHRRIHGNPISNWKRTKDRQVKWTCLPRWGKRDVTTNFTSFSSFSAVSIGSTGVYPKYIIEHSIADHPNKLTAGFDYGRDRLSKDTYADSTKSVKTFFASLEKEVYGFYARDEFNITSAMIFTTGYRREKATIRGSETQVLRNHRYSMGKRTIRLRRGKQA